MKIDVIGDVHGQYEKLVALLRHLDYRDTGGAWRHSDRTAIFVGDLIDRGPNQLATVDLVRRMVDAGAARCIMGNHEFNAIAWATSDPCHPGEYLRPHGKPGNQEQHQAFLEEVVGDTARHKEIVTWFKTLPMWLDLGGIRVVHACWHQESMDRLQPLMNGDQTLTDELIVRGSRRGSTEYEAMEIVCKGPEVKLPDGISFQDKDRKCRSEVRIAWWKDDRSTYLKAASGPPSLIEKIPPDVPLHGQWRTFRYAGPPVVFGHYWFDGDIKVNPDRRSACVDYSAGRGGPLVAYRWDGEEELSSKNLARV
jgi:hypothetical protein